jgi:hypothetical protein
MLFSSLSMLLQQDSNDYTYKPTATISTYLSFFYPNFILYYWIPKTFFDEIFSVLISAGRRYFLSSC